VGLALLAQLLADGAQVTALLNDLAARIGRTLVDLAATCSLACPAACCAFSCAWSATSVALSLT
jgi:hypothetical protein